MCTLFHGRLQTQLGDRISRRPLTWLMRTRSGPHGHDAISPRARASLELSSVTKSFFESSIPKRHLIIIHHPDA